MGDLDEVHLIRVGLPRFQDDGDFGWGQGLMTISQGCPIGVGNDGPMGVSHQLIVGLQDTMRCIVHGVGNRVNVDPAAQVVGTKEAPQEVGVKMFIGMPLDVDLELKEEPFPGDLGTMV